MGNAGKHLMAVAGEHQRRERRSGLDVSVPETLCQRIAEPIAAGLGQRTPSGGQDDAARPIGA